MSPSALSKVSTVSEPITPPQGPYWQMVYYAVSGFFFWSLLMVQIPFIDDYFGGTRVIFYITFCYGLASNLIRIFLIWYYAKSKHTTARRLQDLINYGSILTGLTMAAFPITMAVLGTKYPQTGFWICICLTSCMGVFNSLLMNAGFSLMSLAPEKSATFFLLGQTTTSVIAWPLIIALKYAVAALGGGESTNFIVAVSTLTFAAIFCCGAIPLYHLKTRHHPVFAHILNDRSVTPGSSELVVNSPQSPPKSMIEVFRVIIVPVLCGWGSCIISFCVFPGQVGLWFPSWINGPYDYPLYRSFLIYSYSVADTIGRSLPRWISALRTVRDKIFVLGTLSRGVVFIPLFLMSSMKVWFVLASDWFRLGLIFFFGVTNGVNFSLSNMLGPRLVEAQDKMNVGTLLAFGAINGMFLGALISLGLVQIPTDL